MINDLKNTPVRDLIHALELTLPPGTLKSSLDGTNWTQEDLKRLGLIA
jgi:hypothetical protein